VNAGVVRNRVFYENTALSPSNYRKNPVSLVSRGSQKPGFSRKYCAVALKLSKKPGFFWSRGGSQKPGFSRKYCAIALKLSKKPGFFDRSAFKTDFFPSRKIMYFYVVVYDIPCDKRRKKVFNLLSGYGTWVQYSVFECAVSERQFAELRTRLRSRVNLDEDNIRFYPVSARTLGQVETWGSGPPVTKPPTSVIV